MTTYHGTQAFVFKYVDRLDSDRIFSVFTEDFGRMEILGKAIRKIASKLRGGMEIFSFSEIEFVEGKQNKTLTDAVGTVKFNSIKTNPEKLAIAFAIANLLDHFIKGQEEDHEVFLLISETFSKLHEAAFSNLELIYFFFLWNFFSVLGYKPELFLCALCQQKLNPYQLYFSNQEGGVICKNCFALKKDAVKIKSDIVKVIRLFLEKNWDVITHLKIEKSTLDSLREISKNYANYLPFQK